MFGRKGLFRAAAVCSVLALAASAQADVFSGIEVKSWTGDINAQNKALLVLDFSHSAIPGGSYAFGYRWNDGDTVARVDDGSEGYDPYVNGYTDSWGTTHPAHGATVDAGSSEAMLIVLKTANVIGVTYHTHKDYGFGLDGLSYNGSSIMASDPYWMLAYPSFWWDGNASYQDFGGNTQPAVAPNGELTPSQLGVGMRDLANGFIDAWVQEDVLSHGYNQVYVPLIPTTNAPEPMTLGLLLVGGLGLLRRRSA
ncbi:MAG: PEP-CTERM sorting domain-containing protein [Planctomycetaceae bacterium]|nr:PEP-CTERM sorting domain-containing protein [Planctomycetaceae bacterium]